MTPTLLEHAADKEVLIQEIRSYIDRIVKAQVPAEIHEKATKDKENNIPVTRCGLREPPMPKDNETDEEYFSRFDSFVNEIARSLQYHRHTQTCKKYHAGSRNCRLAMPQPPRIDPTGPIELDPTTDPPKPKPNISPPEPLLASIVGRLENRLILWQLQRPNKDDQRIVDFSPVLTAALRCI